MQTFIVTDFIHGVWSTITIETIAECVTLRATERGMTEIASVEVA